MNKAVTGTFHNAPATKAGAPIVGSLGATRAINDLRAEGFGGDAFALLRRERSEGQAFSSGARPLPFLELPKGIAIGAISGAILGAIAYWALGITMAWASAGINRPLVLDVVVLAIAGAVAGLLEGVAAMGPLRQAKRALNLLDRADETV
ncbi:MAG: hypothetical protein ACRDF8_08310, partial [Chloroflexota bacterium]